MAEQQAPAWTKPVVPMTPDNADKMNDLYKEDDTPSWAKKEAPKWAKPTTVTPSPDWAKPKDDGVLAAVGKATDELGAREQRILDSAGTGIKDAVTKPLTETGNPVAKLGEVGGRAADIAGNTFKAAVSPLSATGGEVLKPAAKPLAKYVAGKVGANPEQAEEIGTKLESSTADVLGDTLANTVAGAAGGAEIPKKPVVEGKPAIAEVPPLESAKAGVEPTAPTEAAKKGEPAPPEAAPKTVSDALFRLSNEDVARRVAAKNTLKAIKGVDNATWEKLYAYKDDPAGVKLSPEEQAVYDKHIKPVAERSIALRKELNKKGVPFDETDTGGAPRKVKGKNALVERIYGDSKAEGKAREGSKLSTHAPTLKARQMWALPGKIGDRAIVFVKEGKLFKDGEPIGELMEGDKVPTAGAETTHGPLEQATTSEIEKATGLEYHKNLLANEYLNWQSLERANDAASFLQWAKKDPGFLEHAAPPGRNTELSEGWRRLNVENQIFDGWKFDPKMAEVIEDYLGNAKSPEEFTKGAMNVAKAMRASIFYNPIRHMVNATNMFATSLGAVKGAKDAVTMRLPVALARATKEVLTQGKEMRAAMKEGLSMPGMSNQANKFHGELMKAMGKSVQADPQAFARLAKEWGYKSTVGMMQGLYRGSSKLLWSYSDILTMARYNMYKMDGLSPREAIRKTHQVMADYRVPSRVAGSRTASKVLQDPRATMFGRYDYNRMANLGGMIKRTAKNDKAGWEARDQLLALAVITTVGYKVVDKVLQSATGEPDAHYGMGGYSSLIDNAGAVANGRKSLPQAAMSAFSPGLMATPLEAGLDQNLYTGKPIVQRGDWDSFREGGDRPADAARMGYDIGDYLAEKFAPVQAVTEAVGNEDPASKIVAEQLGASFPKDNTKAVKYNRNAAKAAEKKRPEWVP